MPDRYRVAIITKTFPPKGGGIASAHYNLYKLLAAEHEVRVFAFDDSDDTPSDVCVRRKSPQLASRLAGWSLSKYVRRRDPGADPVYCRNIASVLWASFALSRPLKSFRPDIVIVPDNYVPALAMRFPKASSVIWMSRNNYKRFENQPLVHKRSWMDVHLAHRLELRALRKAHYVVCPSRYMADVFRKTYAVNRPVSVVYNFVHSETLESVVPSDLRGLMRVTADCRLIYMPSAGVAMKGKRYVFEIIRRLSALGKVGFYLSGNIDRDLRVELESLPGDIAVFAPGHVSYHDNLKHAAACDFAISPTLIENLSNAIVEGLMLGLPFVTFDTGGNKEIVSPGVNGFVVPYLDVEQLIGRSSELLENRELLARMKADATGPLAEMLNPETIRSQYRDVFDKLTIAIGPASS